MAAASFPRGKKPVAPAAPAAVGGAKARPAKKRKHAGAAEAPAEAEEAVLPDALFGKKGVAATAAASGSAKPEAKRQPKKPRVDAKSKSADGAAAAAAKKPASAPALTFKALKKGMLLLGCVRQVNDGYDLLVSLPNKLTGTVSLAESSDEFHAVLERQKKRKAPSNEEEDEDALPALSAVFTVGQFVPCVVLGTGKENKHKQVHLSLRMSLLHAELTPHSVAKGMALHASVASIEDHGAIMNLGIRGLTAFVPVKQLPADGVRKGQQLLVNVLSINAHTNTATVTPDRSQVVKAVTRGDSFTLKQLVPGMLLNVRVEDVLSNGLSVNFLTFFSATVEQNHMSLPCQQGWENSYRKGLKGRARIISIDAVNKQVALSMAPHVVHLQVPESQYVVGDKVEDASIERIDEGIGMLLSLKSGPAAAAEGDDEDMEVDSGATKSSWKSFSPGYVHISNVADDRIDKLEKKFTVGQAVKCRVIGFAPFDGLVMVSCKQSSLNQAVLRHKDLTPGMKVSGKILAMEKWGILLEISEGVRAVVPSQHVPPFVHLKKSGSKKGDSSGKYQVGRTVDARVLRVDADTKKTYLTMKKALLSSELPVLSAFENAKMGTVAHGFITKIADYGVVVTFYNNVYGLVPAAVLHQAGIENLEEAYVLGQVVKASVTRCDVTKKRLALSFSTTATKSSSSTGGSANPTEGDEVSDLIGKTVTNLKVVDVESSCFRVQTSDGLDGVLPFVQLTDFPRQTALVDEQVKKFSAGDVIDTPVLAVSQSKDGVVTFSMKPLLLEYAKKAAVVPKVFEDIKANAVLVGFVASVHATKGVFVKFLNNLVAVAPKAYLREKFLSQIEDGIFEMGETVVCSVESVDAAKKQFVVGFHRQAVFQPARLNARITPFLQAYLREASAIHKVSAPLTIGKVEKAEFLGVRPYGAVFSIEKDGETATVVVPADQADDEWEEGAKVKLVATDYDFEKHIYYGSVDAALVEAGSKKVRKQRTRLTPGSKISSATVVAISSTQKYAVVSFADPTSTEVIQLGVAQLCEFWSPSQTSTELGVEVGATVNCNVLTANLKGVSGAKSSPFEDLPLLAYEVDAVLSSSKPRKKKSSGGGDEKKLPKYTAEDFVVGKLLTGSVAGVKEGSMDIRLRTSKKSGKVITSVSIADVDENPDQGTHPFDRFNIHDHVIGRIIAVVAKGAHKLKPVSDENPAVFHSLHLSLRAADVEGDEVKKATAFVRPDWTENSAGRELLTAGNSIEGVVAEHKNDHLVVKLSHRVHGHLSIVELSDDVDVVRTFREKFPVGKRIKANVLSVNESSQRVELSLIRSSPITTSDGLKSGDVVVGVISSKVSPIRPPAVMVQLAANVFGRVCITELLPPTQWKNAMHDLPQFAKGQVVRCVVLTNSGNHLDLSLRSDAFENPAAYAKAATASIERKVGDLAPAIVTSTTSGGCFVRIDRNTIARVLLRELSDDFVKDPIAEFPTGRLVAGRITKKSDRGLEMSLKASVVSEDVSQLKWSDLKEGSTVKGTITKIQAYGVFVKIDKSAISGLCHISEVADERVTQPLDQIFSEGDYVKAKVLKIEDRRVSFGLKPSYFDGEESSSEEEEEDSDEENEAKSSDDENEAEPMEVDEEDAEPVVKSKSIAKAVPMEVDEDESSEDEDDEAEKTAPVEFTWDGFASVLDSKQSGKAEESDDEETEDEDENPADSAKAGKKKPRANDEWIALREKALASNDEVPQSASDYERLLAVSPQSSFLWIQYMAFHVSLTEVALARDVAVRATSAVSFRDEKEKLNVWTAYLNLEHDFGDDASFMRVFKSALAVNHPKRVYLHLVDLYARAREVEDVETTLATMQKKFRTSKQTWLRALQFYVSENELGKAAETLQRSLQSLAAHKHLPVILKYGQLMFESGELDKARTIFEGILANYPKRVDLWSVYVDKEVKFGGDHALVRALFERLLAMDFSPKKMKFLFKKFLTFEAAHGDAARVEHVKQLAADFVATAAGKQ